MILLECIIQEKFSKQVQSNFTSFVNMYKYNYYHL